MHIVNIIGGLGNQMFQYSFFRALNEKYPDCKIDITEFNKYGLHNGYELERIFNISPQKCTFKEKEYLSNGGSKFVQRLKRFLVGRKNTEYIEADLTYNPNVLQIKTPTYFEGYWQSEKYFIEIVDLVKSDFTFKTKMSQKNELLKETILSSNSISIHVRRGDYINNPIYDGVCNLNYYKDSILLFKSKIKDPKFFVFSNDIEWCKDNLQMFDNEIVYVDWNEGTDSYQDMQLMSLCKHNIIANSSFSWWGAWLNRNKDKIVVAPQRWFNSNDSNCADIVPADWIRV